MLLDSVPQSLVGAANERGVSAAHKFIHDIASLKRRHGILVDCRYNIFVVKLSSEVHFLCSPLFTEVVIRKVLPIQRSFWETRRFSEPSF